MMRLRNATPDVPKTLRSFRYAFQGLYLVFRYENNARVHLLATVATVGLGFTVGLSGIEWAVVLTQIGLVWAAETFNTAIEKLVDLVSPEFNPKAGIVKDIAAGAVLVFSIIAVVVGLIIFAPKVYHLLTFTDFS